MAVGHIDKKPQKKDKKWLVVSYIEGIFDLHHGAGYKTILGYFFPEFITALLLYAFVPLIDARWIADLKSTSLYATVGVVNTLIHFIIKTAEGISVGTIILVGQYNGLKEYDDAGKSFISAFWVTCIVGGVISLGLYLGAYRIYALYGVPQKMIQIGIPFLQIKAISIFCMFVYFAFIGFLRGIKKPRVPMVIFTIGSILFLIFDYMLIFGAYGFPALGLRGSAYASVIQYGSMLFMAILYVTFSPESRKYGVSLFAHLAQWKNVIAILKYSWPVVLDKATFAAGYIWLGYLINPLGKYAIASYAVIKDLERLAIQPAGAFAQVVTFMVSNSYSVGDWDGIKSNIKKIVFLSSLFVFALLFVFSMWPKFFIQFFDQKGKFTEFASDIFPLLSVLVFFDLLQLILSGALRGAANVRVVLYARLAVLVCYFVPFSWWLSKRHFVSPMVKFLAVYGSFYLGTGLISLIYIYRFRGERWKQKGIGTTHDKNK